MSLRLTQLSLLLSVLGALENLTVLATVFLFLLLWEKINRKLQLFEDTVDLVREIKEPILPEEPASRPVS